MSDDKSDKAGSWFGNPLPIVMVVLLAAGVLVKNVPLESARPTDPERVKFVPTSQQDIEARLWQDPFAAVEKHEKNSDQAVTPTENIPMMPFMLYIFKTPPAPHTPEALHERIKELHDKVTVLAVSVFGGSYAEAAEGRRRSRFAVVSALGFHDYHPEDAEAIGYFHIDLPEPDAVNLTVPFEWFERRDKDKSSNVLVLWLNEDKLTTEPFRKLQTLFAKLTPPPSGDAKATSSAAKSDGLNFKLIGPAGSAMLAKLVPAIWNALPSPTTGEKRTPRVLNGSSMFEVFSPSATISDCDLFASVDKDGSRQPWDCFKNSPDLLDSKGLPIIRTTGTDDVLSTALLWELWQRGVNREPAHKDQCEDGLVLISEWDTEYGRTLSRYLKDGFSERCGNKPDGNHATSHSDKPLVRTFTYLRGLDGMLPDIDKSGSKAPSKDDSSKSKDLRAQLEDAPLEHAEERSQFDYLRRLAEEIDRLDHDKDSFAKNGVKAIGIVGSDLYDKLIILQALRSRFQNKIFFTTDLDARYLHADQKDWARNLVVASNFGLSLRPKLQHSTLPFRDSYQTATYLATLMALENQPLDYWSGKVEKWLHPQIFEIGRTEAVHLASPSADDLTNWIKSHYSEGSAPPAKDTTCNGNWKECENIEPERPPPGLSFEHPWAIFILIGVGIVFVYLASFRVQETVRTAWSGPSPARATIFLVIGVVVAVSMTLAIVSIPMNHSFDQGVGEPFVWLEGVSVWPSLVVRFAGLVTMLLLACAFYFWLRHQARQISKDFRLGRPGTKTRIRDWWPAVWTGPYLDLASFDKKGKAKTKSEVKRKNTEEKIEVTALWRNYLRAISFREMASWIVASLIIGIVLFSAAFQVLGRPSFPHRGQLVERLHLILVVCNALVLWPIIFWVGYETRACAQFIKTLSGVPNEWPERLLDRKAKETGVPPAHLDDYLDFQLIVRATKRIHWLIYLPFVSILFMVLARSNFFDAMDFPLALFFVIGLALAYTLHSAQLLRRSAESARGMALEYYETQLLMQARAKDNPSPISVEQIKLLMERIRETHEGAFAPFAQQPALRALLLPFGGYGSVQLIEFLFKL